MKANQNWKQWLKLDQGGVGRKREEKRRKSFWELSTKDFTEYNKIANNEETH